MQAEFQGMTKGPGQYPPLREVRKSFRPNWYRPRLDSKKFRELSQRSDLQACFQTLGHLGLWVVTGVLSFFFFKQELWIGFGVALFLHGTVGTFFQGAAVHELGHGTVFRTRRLNDFFNKIFSTLGWINIYDFKMSHTYHHLYTLHPIGDREVVLPLNPKMSLFDFIQIFTFNFTSTFESFGLIPRCDYFINTALNRYPKGKAVGAGEEEGDWLQALYEGEPEKRSKAVHWARIVLGFHALVILFSVTIGEPILILLISGSAFTANWLRSFVGGVMHTGLMQNVPDIRLNTRSNTLDPISEFLYWHMNWHIEHHMYPGVPCYNLKKLHEATKEDMPQPRTLIGAWREVHAIWRKQQEDPNYEFETPLPPTAHRAVTKTKQAKAVDVLESEWVNKIAPQGFQ